MITTFKDWFDGFDYDSIEEIDDLYNAVLEGKGCGFFEVSPLKNNEQGFVVKSTSYEDLGILTESARKEFLRELEDRYCENMIEPIWYSFHKAMEKED